MSWIDAAAVVAGYFLGSIEFAVWVARARGVDIFALGSGNPGAANVARNLGWRWAALVLAGDLVKGLMAALLGLAVGGSNIGFAAGLAAVVGHCYPSWHRFKGGKGVATAGGAVVALAPWVALVLAVAWTLMARVLKISSVASLAVTLLAVPALAVAGHRGWSLVWAGLTMLLIVVRHRSNIERLARGEESRLSRPPLPGTGPD